jgi:phosphoserine phosphatase
MRAHVFDMDGTLLMGTTAPLLLAEALGATEDLHRLEAEFAAGTLTAVEFAHALHGRWGPVDAAVARAAFGAAPLIAGIPEVLGDLHERGEKACLITMSPAFFADQFLDFGFDAVFASRFPADLDTPLDEAAILNPRDKPRLAGAFCDEHGLRLAEAVAYGDSLSDVFLFEAVGLRVSVNGDHHLAQLADLAVSGPDLVAAYTAVRERLDG